MWECHVTDFRGSRRDSDVIVLDSLSFPPVPRPLGQVWLVYLLESPYVFHKPKFERKFEKYGAGEELTLWEKVLNAI